MRLSEREGAVKFCLSFPHCYEDLPFHDQNWTLIRHVENKKAFAFIYERDGRLCLNLKTEPMTGEFLRNSLNFVHPAYHMNKLHWITVCPDECKDINELKGLISESYRLTGPVK